MGSFWQVPSPLSCNCTNKKGSALCDNPLMKPSRQQAQWAAYFSQYRICVFPIMPTELISLRKFICACCMCQHDLCDIICHGTIAMTEEESVSVIHLHSFPRIDEFYQKKTLGCNRKQKLSRTPEKPDGSSHKCRNDKEAQTCMNSKGTHSKQQVGEHTK